MLRHLSLLSPHLSHAFAASLLLASPLGAQQHEHDPRAAGSQPQQATALSIGGSGIALATLASHAVNGRSAREGYLTQPMLSASLASAKRNFVVDAMVNFEGLTLQRGELNAGIYGEGYVDRRHPHTYLHLLVATTQTTAVSSKLSATAGKGFVPFGTDDPMSRPFVKYPVNHHLAQILERVIVSGAIRIGPLAFEATRFNGDEPESPSDLPNRSRLWDSWAARASLLPHSGLELQGSMAEMKSPEVAQGGGLDQRKRSVSVRYERRGARYALVEWARTSDHEGGRTAFAYSSALAEGALTRRSFTVALRAERTERPEEERLENTFRTPRPHSDFNILGRTRWSILSAGASVNLARRAAWIVAPFVEVSRQQATAMLQPTVFDPRAFYGSDRMWSLSAGARLGRGLVHARMGRYGAAAAAHH